MNIFLDTSVALAASGRVTGASRAVFNRAPLNGWTLMVSPYVISEVDRNLGRLAPQATQDWMQLRSRVVLAQDVWMLDRPVVFGPAKDRPILFTAAAWSEVLLTLDRGDFGGLMHAGFYGLSILTPAQFLERERATGRLK